MCFLKKCFFHFEKRARLSERVYAKQLCMRLNLSDLYWWIKEIPTSRQIRSCSQAGTGGSRNQPNKTRYKKQRRYKEQGV